MPTTSVADLPADAVLLDVREDDEWEAGHAPSALHVPMSQVPARIDELPPGDVAVVCRSGGRSAQVTAWLVHNGHTAVNVDGGMTAWEQAGRPMESSDPGVAPHVL